ncbi:MAG: SDR family oxidoreductase [Deltaproteobacteria bacterium]|nr:SDR family oxidoreductase [Deltaproteobacteria bacterium]
MSSTPSRPVVLITGCSSGIGREVARLFARRGYRVYASMRNPSADQELLAEANAKSWALTTPILDVTSDAGVSGAVAAILAENEGRIDIVVNNAAFYCFGALEETTPDELRAQLETNVIGVHRVIRAVLPAMRARGDGAIVNISSTNGRTALPMVGPYQVSKFGVEALTETLRYEVAPFGIRVACVEPGSFETELHRKQSQVISSTRADSPYAPLLARYRERLGAIPRARVDAVADTIFRAGTDPNPALRWRVGPFSTLACVVRLMVPDRIFELLIRLAFNWAPPRR